MLIYSGAAIRRIRKRQGLSVERVAIDIERTASAVLRYETGTRVPSGPVLGRLAVALGCQVDDFYVRVPAEAA